MPNQVPYRLLAVALAVLSGLVGAAPAGAANQQVQVQDNFFTAASTAVKPGESVTWALSGAGSPHNVSFDDGLFTLPNPPGNPWTPQTVTRTFATPGPTGSYRYYCQVHGGPGGQGMSGIVYVNETGTVPVFAPVASFTVTPGVAAVGETVTLNASATTQPNGLITEHLWDLDGNGSFETNTGTTRTTSLTPSSAGARTIALRVTDGLDQTSQTTRPLVVTNRPTAQFTVSPAPAQVGQAVSFDAGASSDVDGTIANYEWDLDGNGSFETGPSETATATRTYASAATLTIRLRVTDNVGVGGTTTQSLRIDPPPPPPPPPPPVETPPAVVPPPPPAAAAACSTLSGAARAACMQKSCSTLTGTKRASCISKSCRYLTGAKRAACVQTSCRYVAKSKRAACGRTSCRFLTATRRKACLRTYRKP